jgi:hypothetical protein
VKSLTIDSVGSAALHPSWPMLATCSGSNSFDVGDEEENPEAEYSLKVWVFECL